MKLAMGIIGALLGFGLGLAVALLGLQSPDDNLDVSAEDKVAALQSRIRELESERDDHRGRANRLDSTLKSRQSLLEETREQLRDWETKAVEAEMALAEAREPKTEVLSPEEIKALLIGIQKTFDAMSKKQLAGFVDQGQFMDFVNEIKALGDEGLDYALGLLGDGTTEQQILAARILGLLPDARATEALADTAVNEENEGAANAAARSLMTSDSPGAVAAMQRTLANSPHESVKVNTMWGLCRHGDETAIKETLAYINNKEHRRDFRRALEQSAFLIDRNEMRPVIESVVSRAEGAQRENVMQMAINWYGRNQSPENRRSLEAAVIDASLSESIRQSARDALENY